MGYNTRREEAELAGRALINFGDYVMPCEREPARVAPDFPFFDEGRAAAAAAASAAFFVMCARGGFPVNTFSGRSALALLFSPLVRGWGLVRRCFGAGVGARGG